MWTTLRVAFLVDGRAKSRSRVLLTTQDESMENVGSSFKINPLDEVQSRKLLMRRQNPDYIEAYSWSKEYKDKLALVKIDHDLNPQLIEEYRVYGLRTLIIFQNGNEVPESSLEDNNETEVERIF